MDILDSMRKNGATTKKPWLNDNENNYQYIIIVY